MKLYKGKRSAQGVNVTVNNQAIKPRTDLRNFHASGFEWGYEGSGPSQLALAILADHSGPQIALQNYRNFMRYILAEIEDDTWTLTSNEIDRFSKEIVIVPIDLKTLLQKVRGEIK